MLDEVRWNLRLKRNVYDALVTLSSESGAAKADIARLALVKFMNGMDGEEISLRWVREQLRLVEIQLEAKE